MAQMAFANKLTPRANERGGEPMERKPSRGKDAKSQIRRDRWMSLKAQAAPFVIPRQGISGVRIPADSLACRLDRRHPSVVGKTAGNG
jgi:hypothetical protein